MHIPTSKTKPLAQVLGQHSKVLLLSGNRRAYVNLDNAASTPPLKKVWQTLCAAAQWYAGVHRGAGFKGYFSTALYEQARDTVLRFFGGDPERDTVIFVKNTTEALNKLAASYPLKPGSVVISTGMEHHSNDLPWRRRTLTYHVRVTETGQLDLDHLDHLLRTLGTKVALVTVTGASNVTGYVNDVHKIAQMAHRVGAKVVVDAAQLAPHRQIRLLPHTDPSHIDFLAFSGHKLYAPFGSGVLIGTKHLFPRQPQQPGGGTVVLVTEKLMEWEDLPAREEAGSPNVLGAVSLAAALKELQKIGMFRVARHEGELTDRLLSHLADMPHVTVYGLIDRAAQDRVGVVTFNIKGLPHGIVGAYLAYECGIGVRTGCFCAQPYVQRLLGLSDAEVLKAHHRAKTQGETLPGMVRASLGLYNTQADIRHLIRSLKPLADPGLREDLQTRYTYDPNAKTYIPKYSNIWQNFLSLPPFR